MSLATFKKKSLNSTSRATKISGKPTNEYWMYQGPYGPSFSLASKIYQKSMVGPNEEINAGVNNYNASNAGFSINGSNRNIGSIGTERKFSTVSTPFRGVYPKGWGGTRGRYPDNNLNGDYVLNIRPQTTGPAVQNTIVKPSVLSTKGMLARRFRWINSGQYPNYWVQPVYTGNQTDTASQQVYIQNKAAANDLWYDVNDTENYVNYYKTCGSMGCQTTPARGYTMNIQQANAAYTKTLHKPKDSSAYTLYVQRRCQAPVGLQKPFPYAVQTGTGILTGGINVTSVGNACNTSNTVLVPPAWYTGTATIDDQLSACKFPRGSTYNKQTQQQTYVDTVLNGTSN